MRWRWRMIMARKRRGWTHEAELHGLSDLTIPNESHIRPHSWILIGTCGFKIINTDPLSSAVYSLNRNKEKRDDILDYYPYHISVYLLLLVDYNGRRSFVRSLFWSDPKVQAGRLGSGRTSLEPILIPCKASFARWAARRSYCCQLAYGKISDRSPTALLRVGSKSPNGQYNRWRTWIVWEKLQAFGKIIRDNVHKWQTPFPSW